MTGYQYLLIDVPLDDIGLLNEYGAKGYRAVAVVGRTVTEFSVLLEQSDPREPKHKLRAA